MYMYMYTCMYTYMYMKMYMYIYQRSVIDQWSGTYRPKSLVSVEP